MKRLTIVVLVTMMCVVSANADVIAQYTFSGNASATTGANVTAGNFVVGSGLTGGDPYAGVSATASGCFFVRCNSTGMTDLAGAIADIDYISFTINVAAGYQMDLTSLTLQQGYTNNTSQTGKWVAADLLTSASGFTAADSVYHNQKNATTAQSGSTVYYDSWSVVSELSGAEFQGLTGSVEFRFYLTDNTNDTNIIHRFDNIVLNGSVTVGDLAPIVDAGSSYVTWLGNAATLALAGSVDDNGDGDVTDSDVVWSITASPPGSIPTLTKTSTDWANPTANFTPDLSIAGDYTIELTATDTAARTGSDTLVVQVAANACDATQLVDELSIYDVDDNCIIDLSDMAAFAAKWMSDRSLTGPLAY